MQGGKKIGVGCDNEKRNSFYLMHIHFIDLNLKGNNFLNLIACLGELNGNVLNPMFIGSVPP